MVSRKELSICSNCIMEQSKALLTFKILAFIVLTSLIFFLI